MQFTESRRLEKRVQQRFWRVFDLLEKGAAEGVGVGACNISACSPLALIIDLWLTLCAFG